MDVKANLAELLTTLRAGGLRESTERNIASFLDVADAFEADGLLIQAVDCLTDLAGKLQELCEARSGRKRPFGVVEVEEDILAYRDCHNLHVVDERYLTGAEPTEVGYRWLMTKGVTTVISLRLEDEADKEVVERVGMHYVHLAWPDETVPALLQVEEMLDVVEQAPGRVFQHCLRGIGRDLTMCACYRIATHHESASDLIAQGAREAPRWESDQVNDPDSGAPSQFEFLRQVEQRWASR
ncbi:MAG: fused DSP-PTPase phosphatase/NAD kinase-like protein [Acidimicrobiales bacterium]